MCLITLIFDCVTKKEKKEKKKKEKEEDKQCLIKLLAKKET